MLETGMGKPAAVRQAPCTLRLSLSSAIRASGADRSRSEGPTLRAFGSPQFSQARLSFTILKGLGLLWE